MAIDLFRRDRFTSLNAQDNDRYEQLVSGGLQWLKEYQNDDGGWGDTVLSKSNISTTALVWAAFSGTDDRYSETVRRCEQWLQQTAGNLEPRTLSRVIADRYGKDRTFSVPILTTLALRSRLGNIHDAWKLVPQLPFELAAFPHRWFASLKLPVVSYALPALIAIGQVRHEHRPSFNPILRAARNLTRERTLRVLESIQPTSGGFLEATPLTSFVLLSLIGAGRSQHNVVRKGLEFLIASARDDGSWPIDTNLATWVTTLGVNALCASGSINSAMSAEDNGKILDWLLSQQYRHVHPYTNAAPGGWAWTELTGGVPDADDTPGALLALRNLSGASQLDAASAGIDWLLNLQNSDGGMPTFCRGWGVLPFDRSSNDLTAHALRAFSVWHDDVSPALKGRILKASKSGLQFLSKNQRTDGAWAPLWFGNQHADVEENLTYGTSRVLVALATIKGQLVDSSIKSPNIPAAIEWLLSNQNSDGGWGGGRGTPSSIEESSLTIESLCAVLQATSDIRQIVGAALLESIGQAVSRGLSWLVAATRNGLEFPPSPIGFYFAKLWYYEKNYPVVYTLSAVGRAMALIRLEKQENPSESGVR